jgi:hypothetical protein
VKKYGELVEYLLDTLSQCLPCSDAAGQNVYPRFGVVEMDFEGKNLLVYYLGDRTPLSDPFKPELHVVRGQAQARHWEALSNQ